MSAVVLLQANLHGMVEVHRGNFKPLQSNAAYWSSHLKQAVAVCNGLTWVSKTMIVGDDLDRKLFKMIEAHFAVKLLYCVPISCEPCLGVFASS